MFQFAFSTPARAEDGRVPCTLKLAPADASEAWQAAARDVQERLRSAPEDADCRAITVETEGNVGFVLFTTRDGRQTIRRIASPSELAPAIDALLITFPPSAPPPDPTPPPVLPSPIAPQKASPVPTSGSEDAAHAVVTGSTGARFAFPGSFASLALGAGAGLTLSRWEVGVFGRWEPAFTVLGALSTQSFSMWSLSGGVSAGRRAPVGSALLVVGLTASIAATHQAGMSTTDGNATGANEGNNGTALSGSITEPRVGAYFGLIFPRHARLRIRPQLGVDAVPSRLGAPLTLDPELPALPWWTVDLSLAVEVEVL